MTKAEFSQVPQVEPPRDRWGRPMVIPPGGGKAVAYTRCTTYVSVLEDTSALAKWKQRMTAVGLSNRGDLSLLVASLSGDPVGNKRRLDEVCESALEAAKGSAKATVGTALHVFVEQINLGNEVTNVPAGYAKHSESYRRVARPVLTPQLVERFTVCDNLAVAGTPDLIAGIAGEEGRFIVDLKSGPSTLEYGALKTAMQLAVYAHSELYDPATGQRSPLDVRRDKGLVVALNSDTGDCTLHWVDIAAAWEAVQTATQVRIWRKRAKSLVTDFVPPPPPAQEQLPAQPTAPAGVAPEHFEAAILAAISETRSRDELITLWEQAQAHWTDTHTQAAKARLEALANPAAT